MVPVCIWVILEFSVLYDGQSTQWQWFKDSFTNIMKPLFYVWQVAKSTKKRVIYQSLRFKAVHHIDQI